jgi:hypothetical protein
LPDIVISYESDSGIGIFLQNTSGLFDPPFKYRSYDGPLVIGDLDNDGKNDIIISGGGIFIHLQREDGLILPVQWHSVSGLSPSYNPQSLSVGDINGDGLNDIIVVDNDGYLIVLYNTGGAREPILEVSPSSVDFGPIIIGNTSMQNIGIYNRGTGDLIVDSINITGQNASEFSQTNNCSTVEPGHSCQIIVTFAPIAEGTKNATLRIFSNDPNTNTLGIPLFSYAGPQLIYPSVYFPTGPYPQAVVIGDVNSDGRNDVVMTDRENNLHVFLQKPSGKIEFSVKYPAGNGKSVDIGDLNNDGRNDVVVSATNGIGVFIQNNSGTLNPMVTYPSAHASPSNTYKVRIADLNNDGLRDVVCIDLGTQSQAVEIFYQIPNGTLSAPVTYTVVHSGFDDLEVGDVNNDGRTDIMVMSGYGFGPNIGILLQNPDGTFADAAYYDLGGDEPTRAAAVGDINGDGLNDIVVTYGVNQPASKIGIFYQNSSGTFNPPVSYLSYNSPGSVVIADMNGDGRQDVIVFHEEQNAIGVYLQSQDGMLLTEELYSALNNANTNPQNLAVGDINGDGFNEIIITDYYGLKVFYNGRGPAFADMSVSPSSIDFRAVFLRNASSQTITIYNRGPGDLSVNSINITGEHASEFSQTNYCTAVAPGDSCYVIATFAPISEGVKTATMIISSNDPATPTFAVAFSSYGAKNLLRSYVSFTTDTTDNDPIIGVGIGDLNGDGSVLSVSLHEIQ